MTFYSHTLIALTNESGAGFRHLCNFTNELCCCNSLNKKHKAAKQSTALLLHMCNTLVSKA